MLISCRICRPEQEGKLHTFAKVSKSAIVTTSDSIVYFIEILYEWQTTKYHILQLWNASIYIYLLILASESLIRWAVEVYQK